MSHLTELGIKAVGFYNYVAPAGAFEWEDIAADGSLYPGA